MNMDTAEVTNKAKNLNKARTKGQANSLRRWATSSDLEFQQSQSSLTKDPSQSCVVTEQE